MPSCGWGDKARGQGSLPAGPSPKAREGQAYHPCPSLPSPPPNRPVPRWEDSGWGGGTLNCIRSGSEDEGTAGRGGSEAGGGEGTEPRKSPI
ncbi:hypothetical protein E2C01_100491 [Portunus trituberculatus]|uniref:Uncharacterized protein n=1 Tax=Portunus trituberculatus TaxID=210409 RepID=A0A5B7KDG4_PORTR|nr:hypothetical protein [Portunus trituberculatus]